MAMRYSGDVEVRLYYVKKNLYDVRVSWPQRRWRGIVKTDTANNHTTHYLRDTPAAYDLVARQVLDRLSRSIPSLPVERKRALGVGPSKIVIRRVFQAPCPLPR